ncbi:hypothetical protein BK133_05775 [Paenibacillus sp. FSL H8-0548]|uniref:DUF1871 family protein n=1 Tax=Paenibacillus sp. FSL H8-0548 TaxID=1920422 RepID=UPI00096EA17F|nr:DUF1871 family protein [Paenibacillus sp. FSL H8-0548]OMF37558.1 hypothetical protein BK133_05775 [Paenibacillus sp. FSL H8-0548]
MKISTKLLTEVINNWDPIGLLAGGAPQNEYDIEISQIVQKSITCTNEIELAKLIYRVFNDMMGVKLDHLSCLNQAFTVTERNNNT